MLSFQLILPNYLNLLLYCTCSCCLSFFVIVCGLFERKWISAGFFLVYLYMYCRCRSSYQEGRVGIQLTGLTPPHFCACSKPGPWFPTSYVVVFFVFSELRWEVIVPICWYWWKWWPSLFKLLYIIMLVND